MNDIMFCDNPIIENEADRYTAPIDECLFEPIEKINPQVETFENINTIKAGMSNKLNFSNEPSVRVVVAHYNEKLNWLESIPEDYAITVSYAGEEPKIPARVTHSLQIEKTENGGKDCGQWVRWIAKHYDELDDIILFLQGNPYTGHTPEILLNISRKNLKNIFDYFGSGRPFHKSVGKGWQFGELTWIVPSEFHVAPFSCGVWGSQHYATKNVIHRRPKSFYERLAAISLELGGSKFGDICEYYFNVIYGVTIDEVS